MPVIAQDANTRDVLMLAYVDEAGWHETLKTGEAVYYSTSKKARWKKGETSDNVQRVVDMLIDCDGDALVYLVEPLGNKVACHTNARSCFYRTIAVGGQLLLAPKAGVGEELAFTEVPVHANFKDMAGYLRW